MAEDLGNQGEIKAGKMKGIKTYNYDYEEVERPIRAIHLKREKRRLTEIDKISFTVAGQMPHY